MTYGRHCVAGPALHCMPCCCVRLTLCMLLLYHGHLGCFGQEVCKVAGSDLASNVINVSTAMHVTMQSNIEHYDTLQQGQTIVICMSILVEHKTMTHSTADPVNLILHVNGCPPKLVTIRPTLVLIQHHQSSDFSVLVTNWGHQACQTICNSSAMNLDT